MPRIDLTVPFAEKNDAKRLGARWDGERKVWYVPDGVDASAFVRWLPSEQDIGVRSSSYFIAQTTQPCWKCSERTGVFGFILPAGHETLEPDEDDDERMRGIGMTSQPSFTTSSTFRPLWRHASEHSRGTTAWISAKPRRVHTG